MKKFIEKIRKKNRIYTGIFCFLVLVALFGVLEQSQTVNAAVKKTVNTTKKKAKKKVTKKVAKKKAAKVNKQPILNTNSKTIMKINSGLLTTYEDYITYPMNFYTLKVNNKPTKATYKWRSSNPNVASLTYNKKKGTCRVNAKAGGNTTITCIINAKGKKKYVRTCLIRVKNPASSIEIVSEDTTIEKMECDLALDRQYQFLANVKSKYTSDRIYWSISNDDIAAVDDNGFVTPKQEGRTVLTVVAAPAGYNPEIDKYDVVVYAIVLNVIEPMERVTNVSVMTTGEVVVQFSSAIEEGSLFEFSSGDDSSTIAVSPEESKNNTSTNTTTTTNTNTTTNSSANTNKKMTGVSLKATSGAAGSGAVSGYLTPDCTQLYLVPEDRPNGKYKLKISGLVAKNGHLVEDYEDSVTIKNETVNVAGANFVSISRTSQIIVTAVFDKTLVRPGVMKAYTSANNKASLVEISGKLGEDPSTVLYTLTPELQSLSGVLSVELNGYAASGDSAEQGEENVWIVDVDFTFSTKVETLDTSNLPLPAPTNITQATDDNSKVYVIFQNHVDEESARTATNYRFNGGPQITEAEVVSNTDQGCMVGLTIKEGSIPEIKEYEIEVSNIKGFDKSYLAMEAYKQTITMNDNTPPTYKSNQYVKGKPSKIILTFSERIDFGSDAKYFDLEATWTGKDENGNTAKKTAKIYEYEAKASGSDDRVTIEFTPQEELPIGTVIKVSPVAGTGTYFVDEGGNKLELAPLEVQVSS